MNGSGAASTVAALFPPRSASPGSAGRWLLLYGGRPRYLLLPQHTLAVQRRCLRTFRRGIGALVGELALSLHHLLPGRAARAGFDAPAAGTTRWLGEMPLPGLAGAAVQVGTPGPYQKATVLLLGEQGQPLGLAKVAMGVRADTMVQREGAWLRRLRDFEVLAGQVPRLLAEGRTDADRRFIATDLGPQRPAGSAFGAGPRRFLSGLARASARLSRFDDAPARRRLQLSLEQLKAGIPAPVAQVLAAALDHCDRSMAGWSGPTVFAHGDFTPWNTRRGEQGLYVFDWEYGCEGASPAHDALHWLLLPKALRRGGLSARTMRRVRGAVRSYLEEVFPNRPWPEAVIDGLMLHYLLDTMLFYGMADGAIHLEHPVNRNYFRMLERRSQWMA